MKKVIKLLKKFNFWRKKKGLTNLGLGLVVVFLLFKGLPFIAGGVLGWLVNVNFLAIKEIYKTEVEKLNNL